MEAIEMPDNLGLYITVLHPWNNPSLCRPMVNVFTKTHPTPPQLAVPTSLSDDCHSLWSSPPGPTPRKFCHRAHISSHIIANVPSKPVKIHPVTLRGRGRRYAVRNLKKLIFTDYIYKVKCILLFLLGFFSIKKNFHAIVKDINVLKCFVPGGSGDPALISGSGRSPGERNSNPLQHSCLENSMDRGA